MERTTSGGNGRAIEDVKTREEFGELLNELRVQAGLSYRALARKVGLVNGLLALPYRTVAGWCTGTLPARSHHDVFQRLLEVLNAPDIPRWLATLAELREAVHRRDDDPGAPYPGLQSFGRNDAGFYFGREDLTDEALALLTRLLSAGSEPRLLWILGSSGAGKSSLLHAGLCPAIESRGRTCLPLVPGERPVDALAVALATHLGVEPAVAREVLRSEPDRLLAHALDRSDVPGSGVVLIVDQFEELFQDEQAAKTLSRRAAAPDALGRDEPQAAESQVESFLTLLDQLTRPDSALGNRCAVVAGLRSDFYANVAVHEPLTPSLQRAQIIVNPMTEEQLRMSVVEPARLKGVDVDQGLVDRLLRDFVQSGSLAGQHAPGALPLLAYALRETWHFRADRKRMTVDDYEGAGGVGGAITESAERTYSRLARREQALLMQVFLRLVHVDDRIVTSRTAAFDELVGLAPGDGRIAELIGPFIEQRLLTVGRFVDDRRTVEIAHEMLVPAWPRLRRWIDDRHDAIRVHRAITEATRAWLMEERDASLLASGLRLEAMRTWLQEAKSGVHDLQPTTDERSFILASQERAAQEEIQRRRRTRRLGVLALVTTASTLLAASLAVVANRAHWAAVSARDDALSRQTALHAGNARESDPSLASQLAVAAYEIAPTAEARAALLEASVGPTSSRYLGGAGPAALATSDGTVVAVGNSAAATVQLLTPTGAGLERAGVIDLGDQDREIYALALTPDGGTLAVGDTAAEITVWDVSDPSSPAVITDSLHGPEGPVQRLDISSDGSELAAAGEGEGVFRWDITDPYDPTPLALLPEEATTHATAYSPDGRTLAVGDEDGRIHLWDITGEPEPAVELQATERPVVAVDISPDGTLLAAGAQDGELRVWDLGSPEPVGLDIDSTTFDSWVNTVAFSPDGTQVAAGSSDLSLRIWDTETWTVGQVLPHAGAVTGTAYVDGGQGLISTAVDGAARYWDLSSRRSLPMEGRVWSIAFTADATRIAGISGGEARVWDAHALHEPAVGHLADFLRGLEDPISGGGDMSPDGTLLALGALDSGDVYLIDIAAPGDPQLVGQPLGESTGVVEQTAFSPDGAALIAGGNDTAVRVWDISDPARPSLTAVLDEPREIVLNMAWHPVRPHIAVPSADNHVYLYDLTDLDEPRLLTKLGGFSSEAYAAAFSPDGTTLAVGGSDSEVILWDVTDPEDPQSIGPPITGPVARVIDLAYHPDGERLAAAVTDGTTWLWDVSNPESPAPLAVLGPTDSPMYTAEFSPAGDILAASGADGEIRIWSLDEAAIVEQICRTAGDAITEQEWEIYFPGRSYRPPCN